MLVVPVRRDGALVGIGLMCGASAFFDDATVGMLATVTHAAFAARARVVPAEDDAHIGQRPRLTPREQCIVDFAAEGLSEAEIAATLGISRRTVRFHLGDMRERLGVDTRRFAADRTRWPRSLDR